MPGIASHVLIADVIADKVPHRGKDDDLFLLLNAHRSEYLFGAIAPDMLVLAPDFGDWSVLLLRLLTDFYDRVIGPVSDLYDTYLRPIEEGLEDIEDEIHKELDEVTCGLVSGLGGIAEEVTAETEEFVRTAFLYLATDTINAFDLLVPPIQKGEDIDGMRGSGSGPQGWTWFDMVHYRHTGDLIRNMWQNATEPSQQAFVLGWATHYAADTVGHAAVNAMVGGPYRSHNQRHHFVENLLDTELFDLLRDEEVLDSKIYQHLPRAKELGRSSTLEMALQEIGNVPDALEPICDLLDQSIRQTYPTPPRRITGGYLDATQLYGAYWYTLIALMVTTSSGVLSPPEPPAEEYLEHIRNAFDELAETAQNPPDAPGAPPPFCADFWSDGCSFDVSNVEEWLDYAGQVVCWMGEVVAWFAQMVADLIDSLNCLVTGVVLTIIRAGLWVVHYSLYSGLSILREGMVLNALMPPDRLWLHTHPLASSTLNFDRGLEDMSVGMYPRQARPSNAGFQEYPDTPVEPTPTIAAPHDLIQETASFVMGAVEQPDLQTEFAESVDPRETKRIESRNQQLGFASVETLSRQVMQSLVDGGTVELPDWNMDADRGYGYLNWTYEGIGSLPDSAFLDDKDLDEMWAP